MSDSKHPPVSDARWWDDHYRRGDTGWDIGQGAPPFARWLAANPAQGEPIRVAVLGSGMGHDARLFARAGHAVTGFDFSPTAVAAARAVSAQDGVNVRFEQADIFGLPGRYRGAFDLVVEHTCFCAIDPARRGEYVEVVSQILVGGGRLVGLFYMHGQPGGPPYTTSWDEIMGLFSPRFDIHVLERATDSIERRADQELFAAFGKRG